MMACSSIASASPNPEPQVQVSRSELECGMKPPAQTQPFSVIDMKPVVHTTRTRKCH
jgi:hypothetical protein